MRKLFVMLICFMGLCRSTMVCAQVPEIKTNQSMFVFDESMSMDSIQSVIDSIYTHLTYPKYHFTSKRYALLFKPGVYHLDVKVGYYTHVIGLGESPEDVKIVGAVRSNCDSGGHVLCNFWRAVENLTIVPTSDDRTNTWAVSQAAPLRRVHVKGNLKLFEGASSGGFMANCKVDGTIYSGSQQQWFTRNSEFKEWNGGVWNMVYLGVENAPAENWPTNPVTAIDVTPVIREKPYWAYSNTTGEFSLIISPLYRHVKGTNMNDAADRRLNLSDFLVAYPGMSARFINKELARGKHLLFTPGIYQVEEPIEVKHANTVVMGMGMATLIPTKGNMAIKVDDVPGVIVGGIMIDATLPKSDVLMRVGGCKSDDDNVVNPICLYDLFFRIGGPHVGASNQCLQVNSNSVIIDHCWLWRADHGDGVAWNQNRCANGLVVNGDNVTAYGLFNEHFQEYQTIWNGENGRVYMYQSEMPYDPPTPQDWKHGETYGYASYKVADHVKQHHAWGVGIYNVFFDAPIIVDQAIETPKHLEQNFYHKVIFWLNGHEESFVKSIINGKGSGVNKNSRKSTMQ